MTALTAADRWEIQQTLSYYGHLVDNGEWAALGEIVADDALLETPLGEFTGPAGVRAFEEHAFPSDPPAHHTLNTVVRPGAVDGTAVAWSRFLLVTYGADVLGGDYLDSLVRVDGDWKITRRRVTDRNRVRPDGEYSAAGAEDFASWQARA